MRGGTGGGEQGCSWRRLEPPGQLVGRVGGGWGASVVAGDGVVLFVAVLVAQFVGVFGWFVSAINFSPHLESVYKNKIDFPPPISLVQPRHTAIPCRARARPATARPPRASW